MPDLRIRISEENWKGLNGLKNPGESFNDVIRRLLELVDVTNAAADHNRDLTLFIEEVPVPYRDKLYSWQSKMTNILSRAAPFLG